MLPFPSPCIPDVISVNSEQTRSEICLFKFSLLWCTVVCIHINRVMCPFLWVIHGTKCVGVPCNRLKAPLILTSLPKVLKVCMLYLYALVVSSQVEGCLTMSKSLGITLVPFTTNSILDSEISLLWVYSKSKHGTDSLLLGVHELVRYFYKGVEMYLSFTPINESTVGSWIGGTCLMSKCKRGIKCKPCNDFSVAHRYGQTNLWIEFVISHMQCLQWGPEFKHVTLWPNPGFQPKILMPWYFKIPI